MTFWSERLHLQKNGCIVICRALIMQLRCKPLQTCIATITQVYLDCNTVRAESAESREPRDAKTCISPGASRGQSQSQSQEEVLPPVRDPSPPPLAPPAPMNEENSAPQTQPSPHRAYSPFKPIGERARPSSQPSPRIARRCFKCLLTTATLVLLPHRHAEPALLGASRPRSIERWVGRQVIGLDSSRPLDGPSGDAACACAAQRE